MKPFLLQSKLLGKAIIPCLSVIDQFPVYGCVRFHLSPTWSLAQGCKEKGISNRIFSGKGIKIALRQLKSQTMALSCPPLYIRQHPYS